MEFSVIELEMSDQEIYTILLDSMLLDYLLEILNNIEHETIEYSSVHEPCSICIEDFKPIDIICKTKCGHIYHKKCIDEWHTINNTCPICRTIF